MRVVLVSDAHLAGPDDPEQGAFLRFLGGVEADLLVLGGDLFQHWWHFAIPGGRTPFPAYAPVVDALRRRGIPLVVLPGNHDFHAPAYFAAPGVIPAGVTTPGVDGRVYCTWDGLRVLLAHGDEADTSPGYAVACALLRGRAFGALVDALGPERGWRFLGRLVGHGAVRPNPALCAAQVERAASLLREAPADLVVFGHTHAPGIHTLGGGRYLNLGAFTGLHTYAVVEGGDVRLCTWEG